MARNNQNGIIGFLIITVILYSLMPILSVVFSQYLTTYSYMLICAFVFLSITFAYGFQSLEKYISMLFPFIIYQALTLIYRTSDFMLWGYSVLLFLLPLIIGQFFFFEADTDLIKKSFSAMRFALVATIITTIAGCIRNPTAARILATIDNAQDARNISFTWQNIGGYGFVYTVVLLYPLIIYAYKQKRIAWFIFVPLAVSAFLLAIVTEYTTALLLLITSSVLIFLSRKLSLKGIVIFGLFSVIFILLFQGTISDFLVSLADKVDSKILSDRIIAFAGGKESLEASDDKRIWLYRRSFETFLSSPLFGNMFVRYGSVGGHSAILDVLAQYGLIGLGVLYAMYKRIYNVFIKPYSNNSGYGFIVWTFIQAIFLSAINTGLWFEVLALYMPIILFSINNKKRF